MILRPSAAPIWTKCYGYPKLAASLPPQPDSDPSRQGTCAAWVAEKVLSGDVAQPEDLIGAQHENGWVVDTEIARHIRGYVKLLRSYGGTIYPERRVVLNPLIAGTPDASGVCAEGILRVDDLKYGFDIVEPNTPQILIYAGALYRLFKAQGVAIRSVRLGIYQPRAYHPAGIHRTRSLTITELEYHIAQIEAAAGATQDPNAMCMPGEHCRRCDAAAKCAAVAHESYRAIHRMHHAQERHMTAEELAEELAFLDLAEAMFKGRRDAVQAEAEARVMRGENIPGWHMEQGYGQRKWKVGADTIRMLTGIDPTTGKMVTPAELERLGADTSIVSGLTETPRTKAKLKPIPHNFIAGKFGGKS